MSNRRMWLSMLAAALVVGGGLALLALWAGADLRDNAALLIMAPLMAAYAAQALTSGPRAVKLRAALPLLILAALAVGNSVLSFFHMMLDRSLFLGVVVVLMLIALLPRWVRPARLRYAIVALVGGGLALYLAQTISVCAVAPCAPAPWDAQRRLIAQVLAQRGPAATLTKIRAETAYLSSFLLGERPDLEITLVIDSPGDWSTARYRDLDPARTLDRPPPPAAAEAAADQLAQIRVGPREAWRLLEAEVARRGERLHSFRDVAIWLEIGQPGELAWRAVGRVAREGTPQYVAIDIDAATGAVTPADQP